jgi:hypothetical protein
MNRQRLIVVLFTLIIVAATYTTLLNQAIAAEKSQVNYETIKGKVVQTEHGVFVLKTTWRKYRLTGMDLSRLLGNKVKVTGTVSKSDSGRIINVIKCEKIK